MAWHDELVTAIIHTAQEHWRQGIISRKFYDEMKDEGISDGDIVVTLSRRSYIALYFHDERREERIGFWHPKLNLFIAWSPLKGSRLITVFRPRKRERYLREELQEVRTIWRPD